MFARYIANFNQDDVQVHDTDIVVVGTGIAGLYTALKISEYADVTIICKKGLTESNTNWAQGGIAAAIAEEDSPELHRADTLMAGAELNSLEAVDVLVNEGRALVNDLIRLGTHFDTEGDDDHLALTMEGAHSRRRTCMPMAMPRAQRSCGHWLYVCGRTHELRSWKTLSPSIWSTLRADRAKACFTNTKARCGSCVAKRPVLATGGAGTCTATPPTRT